MPVKLRWSDFAPDGGACRIASYDLNNSFQPELHTHDYAEIYWITEGKGREIGSLKKKDVYKGCLSIIHPKVVHRFGTHDHMSLINVAFPASTLKQLAKLYDSAQLTNHNALPSVHKVKENGLAELNRAVNELIRSPNEMPYLWRFLTRCMCTLLPENEAISSEAPEWLRRACHEIREPKNARIGIKGFQQIAGRSPEHISRCTRRWTGKSPREIVQDARLDMVANELALTDKPIIEITLDAGFDNLGHCSKVFKQKFGMPLAAYRKSKKRLPDGIKRYKVLT